MWLAQICTPIATANRQDAEFGDDNSSSDGGRDFLRCLNAKTNVTFRIPDNDNSLEARTLTSTSLFLNGLDLDVGMCVSIRVPANAC